MSDDDKLTEYRLTELFARIEKLEARPDHSKDIGELIQIKNKALAVLVIVFVYMIKEPFVNFWKSFK